jgi:osmotically-inducible protein OsmY
VLRLASVGRQFDPLAEVSMISDKTLQHQVLAELEFEPSINAAHIGVTAQDGVVTLTGHVGGFEQKLAAERAARRVRGVKAVAQEIEVRLASDKKCADDEIAERALKILSWDPALPPNRIYVRVDHGLVMLHGSVDLPFQGEEAERQVRKLSGVVGVINEIQVSPKPALPDTCERVDAALRRNAEIGNCNIGVYDEYGNVVLTGTVHNWRQREVAERIAWSVPGVNAVDNKIILEPQP